MHLVEHDGRLPAKVVDGEALFGDSSSARASYIIKRPGDAGRPQSRGLLPADESSEARLSLNTYIHGIGTAVPQRSLNPAESAALFRQACSNHRTEKLMRRIIRLTGIETRYLAVLDQQFGDCTKALYLPAAEQPDGPGMTARHALFDEAAAPLVAGALRSFTETQLQGVDALVTASCTHASSPGLERPILAGAPIRTNVDRWNLGFMGCSAALAALRLVHQMREQECTALVVSCELSSLHFQYTDSVDQLTANMLFSDGAAAMLLSSQPSSVRVVDCCCATLPQGADQMVWTAGDHGLRLALSQELPQTLAESLPAVVTEFLADNRIVPSSVHHWLVHPGGPQILDAVESCLKLRSDALAISRRILRDYGNMSSPTILFILKELIESLVEGTCVAMAFGPGLTIELALLRLDRGAS